MFEVVTFVNIKLVFRDKNISKSARLEKLDTICYFLLIYTQIDVFHKIVDLKILPQLLNSTIKWS